MALNPQTKSQLALFTTAAKHIIFNADRMEQFMQMMDTQDGAIKAVQTVLSAIERKKPVPADVAPLLAVNIYLLMVDMAQEAVGQKPNIAIVKKVIYAILQTVSQSHPKGQAVQPAPQATPARPRGLINQGVAA